MILVLTHTELFKLGIEHITFTECPAFKNQDDEDKESVEFV